MLGVGVSFATTAKLNNPRDQVVVISGDGAFLSGGLSIEAAFQENLPIVVVIDSNGGLDCISQQQERLFTSETHFATDFRDIPFHGGGEGRHGTSCGNADFRAASLGRIWSPRRPRAQTAAKG